jgi:hypothetical protein
MQQLQIGNTAIKTEKSQPMQQQIIGHAAIKYRQCSNK